MSIRYLSRKYNPSDYACKDGSVTPPKQARQLETLHEQVVRIWDAIERQVGGAVMLEIISGYRSPAHNAKVDGKPKSEHMDGQAIDFRVHGPLTVAETHALVDRLRKDGTIIKGGLGRYDTFVHYDTRGYNAQWDFRSEKRKKAEAVVA